LMVSSDVPSYAIFFPFVKKLLIFAVING